jgi:hypothetical protein
LWTFALSTTSSFCTKKRGAWHHYPQTQSSLTYWSGNLLKRNEIGMSNLGVFGYSIVEEYGARAQGEARQIPINNGSNATALAAAAPGGFGGGRGLADGAYRDADRLEAGERQQLRRADEPGGSGPGPEPTVRKNFADTAYWTAALTANKDGIAEFSFNAPDQLTAWNIRVWTMGHGTRVGQGEATVVTKKDLIVRLRRHFQKNSLISGTFEPPEIYSTLLS